ncbi:hypothetical protein E2562_001454 [Oryza meyeriana var. granulata]|uniref:Uncharacterized protein n=1 Tax=Oryza meyeriana var. granulata TaxID=110450 RepID=A0A6G1DC84_9ORYZ|nr:hypothetical protein E2562_001454 [Oryza meyeriana var. granulata]
MAMIKHWENECEKAILTITCATGNNGKRWPAARIGGNGFGVNNGEQFLVVHGGNRAVDETVGNLAMLAAKAVWPRISRNDDDQRLEGGTSWVRKEERSPMNGG